MMIMTTQKKNHKMQINNNEGIINQWMWGDHYGNVSFKGFKISLPIHKKLIKWERDQAYVD